MKDNLLDFFCEFNGYFDKTIKVFIEEVRLLDSSIAKHEMFLAIKEVYTNSFVNLYKTYTIKGGIPSIVLEDYAEVYVETLLEEYMTK